MACVRGITVVGCAKAWGRASVGPGETRMADTYITVLPD